jgi:hypothetical protein
VGRQRGSRSTAILLASEPLPDGAIAQVIRDPAATEPRLLVVSAESLDDEVLALATYILRQSEINTPDVRARREITIWRDRRYRVDEAGPVREGAFNFTWLAGAMDDESKGVRSLAARAGRKVKLGASVGLLVGRDVR